VDQVLNRGITSDIVRQMKIPAAICSNDAKSCYDRIVHSITSLSMQRVKVPPGPIICMLFTIQCLNHYIRTIYGDSELSFTGELWTVPIQGEGQGNGAGPQIWALVSTPVLDLLQAVGYGAFFKAVISGQEIHFVGYGFVDDVASLSLPSLLQSPFNLSLSNAGLFGYLVWWNQSHWWWPSPNQVLLVPNRLHLEAWQCLICYSETVSWGAAYG
jgi:hypothetical protein